MIILSQQKHFGEGEEKVDFQLSVNKVNTSCLELQVIVDFFNISFRPQSFSDLRRVLRGPKCKHQKLETHCQRTTDRHFPCDVTFGV